MVLWVVDKMRFKVTEIFKCSHFGTEKYVFHIHGLKSNCEQKYKVQKHSHELWVVYESISHDHKRLVNQRTTSSACNRLSGYSRTSFQQASIFWRTRFQKVCKNHQQFDIHPILFEGKVLHSCIDFPLIELPSIKMLPYFFTLSPIF